MLPTMNRLPSDLFVKIFSYLGLPDAINFSSTCKALVRYRAKPELEVFAIFRLAIAMIQPIPSPKGTVYAQFYEKNLWRVYTDESITRDECQYSSLKKCLDIAKQLTRDGMDLKPADSYPLLSAADLRSAISGHGHSEGFFYRRRVGASLDHCFNITNDGILKKELIVPNQPRSIYYQNKDSSILYVGNYMECTIWKENGHMGAFNVLSTVDGGSTLSTIRFQALDNDRLLSVSQLGLCRVWNIQDPINPKMLREMPGAYAFCLGAAVVGSKEQWLIIFEYKRCQVWDFQKGVRLHDLEHEAEIRCFTLINDQFLVLGYSDKSVRIWNIFKGKNIFSRQLDMEIFDVRFDGKKLWVAGDTKVAVLS